MKERQPQPKNTPFYQSDRNGLYRLDREGNKWRPLDVQNGRIVIDTQRAQDRRTLARKESQQPYRAYPGAKRTYRL